MAKKLEIYFNIVDYDPAKYQTQLHQPLYEAWVRKAADPDVHVPAWLKSGTPMGIRKTAERAGIFPPVDQQVPTADRRPLLEPDETFINYSSIEESEHGEEVLGELVDKGFVDCHDSLEDVISALGGDKPTL